MKNRMKILGVALILLSAAPAARSELTFEFDAATMQVSPGATVSFVATLGNTGGNLLFLNGTNFTLGTPGLTLNDDPFFEGAPLSLEVGETWTGEIFQVIAGTSINPGSYSGTFAILGGTDGGSQDTLRTAPFTIVVPSAAAAVPEPCTVGIAAAWILSMAGSRGMRRQFGRRRG